MHLYVLIHILIFAVLGTEIPHSCMTFSWSLTFYHVVTIFKEDYEESGLWKDLYLDTSRNNLATRAEGRYLEERHLVDSLDNVFSLLALGDSYFCSLTRRHSCFSGKSLWKTLLIRTSRMRFVSFSILRDYPFITMYAIFSAVVPTFLQYIANHTSDRSTGVFSAFKKPTLVFVFGDEEDFSFQLAKHYENSIFVVFGDNLEGRFNEYVSGFESDASFLERETWSCSIIITCRTTIIPHFRLLHPQAFNSSTVYYLVRLLIDAIPQDIPISFVVIDYFLFTNFYDQSTIPFVMHNEVEVSPCFYSICSSQSLPLSWRSLLLFICSSCLLCLTFNIGLLILMYLMSCGVLSLSSYVTTW